MRDPADPAQGTGDVTARLHGLGSAVRDRVAVPAYDGLTRRAVRRRRRRQGAVAAAAALVLAGGGVGLLHPSAPDRSSTATVPRTSTPTPGPTSAGPTGTSPSPSPSPSTGATSGETASGTASSTATGQAGSAAPPAPDAPIFGLQYAGTQRAVAVWRSCRDAEPCRMIAGYTEDGWASARTLVPADAGPESWIWTRLLPGRGAAVVTEGGRGQVLTTSGTTPLIVSTRPAPPGPGTLLVGPPPLPSDVSPNEDASLVNEVWVLDPTGRSLHPLATQPVGPHGETVVGALHATADGTTYVLLARPPQGPGEQLRVAVAHTADGGLTWSTSPVPTPGTGPTTMPGYLVAGPGGRVAVLLTSDGATVAPFVELWTSADHGQTWRQVPAAHHPDTVGGLAYAPDGTLLVAQSGRPRLWRLTASGTDLEPVPGAPAIDGFRNGVGVVVGDVDGSKVALSEDGRTWRVVAPAARLGG